MSAIHDKQISQEKKDIVAALKEEMQSAKGAVFTTYKGLTVAQDTQLRRALREAGVSYHVIKNTLTTIAAKELGLDGLVPHLNGTTALASSKEDAVAPAKVISEFIKKNKLADAG
ncbi:MAG: 50S ribosomal protein L10, partial [Schwartzia sp.]|nr:50S ribosomal protein L10 [Schwartzia sp. (in: firmicutes)]